MLSTDHSVYEFTTRVRYSQADHTGCMTLPAIVDAFQDCSIFHSEAVGLGALLFKEEQKAWLLSHWHIEVERCPELGEEIVVGTFPSKFKAVTANRNFYVRDAAGSLIVRADSTWCFMDFAAGKPARPGARFSEPYGLHDPLEMPSESRKIAVPDELAPCSPITIRRSQIDTNEHVNNCQYVRMALDCLPADAMPAQVSTLRVDFKRSAVLGDVVFPSFAQENGRTAVKLSDNQGEVYGIVEIA